MKTTKLLPLKCTSSPQSLVSQTISSFDVNESMKELTWNTVSVVFLGALTDLQHYVAESNRVYCFL